MGQKGASMSENDDEELSLFDIVKGGKTALRVCCMQTFLVTQLTKGWRTLLFSGDICMADFDFGKQMFT